MKITFKKEERLTGLASIGESNPNTKIKVDKLLVGYIVSPNRRFEINQWSIQLAKVREPTQAEPAPFKWATMTKKFDTEPEARIYIKEGMLERLNFELYKFPND